MIKVKWTANEKRTRDFLLRRYAETGQPVRSRELAKIYPATKQGRNAAHNTPRRLVANGVIVRTENGFVPGPAASEVVKVVSNPPFKDSGATPDALVLELKEENRRLGADLDHARERIAALNQYIVDRCVLAAGE